MKKAVFLLSLICSLQVAAYDNLISSIKVSQHSNPKTVHVVLLAGQSNMAGAGNYNELKKITQKRIEKIGKRIKLSTNGKLPTPLSYYLKKDAKQKYGFEEAFGPELYLGLELAEQNPKQKYLFIKRVQGGTSLYGAWNPDWSAEKSQAVERGEFKQGLKLYELHLNDVRKNLAVLDKAETPYKIIGTLWMQGENDAGKEVAAVSYGKNLTTLISCYRQAFNLPQMPFVVGQINSTYGRFKQGPTVVREAMVRIAYSDEKVALIRTSTDRSWSDFPKHSDNVHYNTKGQIGLGKAFALRLMELQ